MKLCRLWNTCISGTRATAARTAGEGQRSVGLEGRAREQRQSQLEIELSSTPRSCATASQPRRPRDAKTIKSEIGYRLFQLAHPDRETISRAGGCARVPLKDTSAFPACFGPWSLGKWSSGSFDGRSRWSTRF